MRRLGLYIHIPFCMKKCNYCDFLSLGGMSREDHAAYINALSAELKYYADKGVMLDSVYIGGGTPSLLDPGCIARIMDRVREYFFLSESAEVTIEINPGLLDSGKLRVYREAGINRLSIGVQSLNDEMLRFMGRIHDSDTFLRNFISAREQGFENISVDLMFSVPGQAYEVWLDSLARVIALGPEHISFYGLQIEEGTPFFNLRERGAMKPVEDETDRRMYHSAIDLLESRGYRHYEISNAAKPGYESRHNLKYWSMEDYLGVGLGAHSYMDGKRFSNATDLESYLRISAESSVIPGSAGTCPSPWTAWFHENTLSDEISEFLFTGLRKTEGISLSAFEKRFGRSLIEIYEKSIAKHEKSGLMKIDLQEERLWLTPGGMDIFNQVLMDFV